MLGSQEKSETEELKDCRFQEQADWTMAKRNEKDLVRVILTLTVEGKWGGCGLKIIGTFVEQ